MRFLVRWRAFHSEAGANLPESAVSNPAHPMSSREIAAEYGIEECLLYSYRARARPGLIVLRADDFKAAPREPGVEKVQYRLPSRNLSCADMSLAKVTLQPEGETKPNSHPGYEAILMTAGEAALYFEQETSPAALFSNADDQLCHFRSSRRHRVVNTGPNPAEFLVVRFHRDGDAAEG